MEKVTDLTFLQKFSGGDKARLKKYVDMYLQTAGTQMQQITQSIADQNWPQLKTAAHTLKAQVGYMGMNGTQELLKAVEEHAMNQTGLDLVAEKADKIKAMVAQSEIELRNFLAEN